MRRNPVRNPESPSGAIVTVSACAAADGSQWGTATSARRRSMKLLAAARSLSPATKFGDRIEDAAGRFGTASIYMVVWESIRPRRTSHKHVITGPYF
jgi:hypothetical protein